MLQHLRRIIAGFDLLIMEDFYLTACKSSRLWSV